jgi:hypothetical protein
MTNVLGAAMMNILGAVNALAATTNVLVTIVSILAATTNVPVAVNVLAATTNVLATIVSILATTMNVLATMTMTNVLVVTNIQATIADALYMILLNILAHNSHQSSRRVCQNYIQPAS